MHRFFLNSKNVSEKHFSIDDQDVCHQMARVLKLRQHAKIILLNNQEEEFNAEIEDIGPKKISGKIIHSVSKPDISHRLIVHLFVPPLKNQSRFEWMLEKGTEIGVSSFTPLITQRTEVKNLRKIERLKKIIQEAAEQSGRTKLPILHEPVELKKVPSEGSKLLFSLHASSRPLSHSQRQTSNYQLFFGPVGDFTKEEVEWAIDAGFLPIILGHQILRTETAAIAASSLLLIPHA